MSEKLRQITNKQAYLIKSKLRSSLPEELTPEQALWFAVIKQAITDMSLQLDNEELIQAEESLIYIEDKRARKSVANRITALRRTKRDIISGERFLFGKNEGLEGACNLCGLDADYVRRIFLSVEQLQEAA